jgi:hypothetical protein
MWKASTIFQDKRIAFGDQAYRAKAHLAVCHWSENVEREFTSVWNPARPNVLKTTKRKKNDKWVT